MDGSTAAWMALAWRSALPTAEQWRIAAGPGPDPSSFPPEVLEKEQKDLEELESLDVAVITLVDPRYPECLRGEAAPLVLQVAGRVELLDDEATEVFTAIRGSEGDNLRECLDAAGRAVLVLPKGLLKARTILRALHEHIENGTVAVVSAEPPRAAWGPSRDLRKNQLARSLRKGV